MTALKDGFKQITKAKICLFFLGCHAACLHSAFAIYDSFLKKRINKYDRPSSRNFSRKFMVATLFIKILTTL